MFNDNLFVDNHSVMYFISLFISIIKSSGLLPDKNKLESSAKNKEKKFSDTFAKCINFLSSDENISVKKWYGKVHSKCFSEIHISITYQLMTTNALELTISWLTDWYIAKCLYNESTSSGICPFVHLVDKIYLCGRLSYSGYYNVSSVQCNIPHWITGAKRLLDKQPCI